MPARRSTLRQRASSLVTTLMVIVVLTIIVIAFMQSMSIERLTSRSYANKYQAELAAEAGLQQLVGALGSTITSNRFYIVSATNFSANPNGEPLLLLRQNNPTVLANTVPLSSGNLDQFLSNRASGPSALTNFMTNLTSADPNVAVDLNRLRVDGTNLIDPYAANRSYPAAWQYLTNAMGTNLSRFAYVSTDEQGKINQAVSQAAASSARDDAEVINGSDIPISGTNGPFMLSSASLAELQTQSGLAAFGQESLGQIYPDTAEFRKRKPFYSFLRPDRISEEEFIPSGYTNAAAGFVPYPDAGKPKYNLNDLATKAAYGASDTQRAIRLAAIINSNLPLFKLRDPSFSPAGNLRYIERLAASIVDYIDSDSTTTQLPDGAETEPAGTELQGVVLGVMERFRWVSETVNSTGGWDVGILHSVYVQLWNPYQKTVTGTLDLEVETLRPVKLANALDTPLSPLAGTTSVTLRPNEIRAFKIAETTDIISTSGGDQPSSAPANYPRMDQTASEAPNPAHSRFRASWNGALSSWTPNDSSYFDERGPGLEKGLIGSGSMALNGDYLWSANFPQHYYSSDKGYRSVADPRQSFNQNYDWQHRSIAAAEFRVNGRSNYTITGNSTGQDYEKMWIGRDYLPYSPVLGITMAATNEPHLVSMPYDASPATESRRFPSFIRNDKMRSIGELGHIYDSASVNELGIAAQGGTPSSWHISGGGRTLRIGQPEFNFNQTVSLSGTERRATNWSSPGIRSQHLLDLFTIAETNSLGVPARAPRINLNTARREVLQSLFLNLQPVTDASSTNSAIGFASAGAIADRIITNRPYINSSDFHKFLPALAHPASYTPALGPTNYPGYPSYLSGSGTVGQAMVADRAVEETFRRTVETLGVTSQVLRVFVIGEALGRKNKVLARSIIEAVLLLRQQPVGANAYQLAPEIIYLKRM